MQDVQKHIGRTIRKLCKSAGLTQDVFADRSGLNRAHVGEIERGESNVTIKTLKIIADTLRVKISDLILIRLFQEATSGSGQPSDGGSPRSDAPRISSYLAGFCPAASPSSVWKAAIGVFRRL